MDYLMGSDRLAIPKGEDVSMAQGARWRLSEDGEAVIVDLPTNPPSSFSMDAVDIDKMLQALGDYRGRDLSESLHQETSMIIDHDPNETPEKPHWFWDPPGLWWSGWAIIALLWVGEWYSNELNWRSIALGIITGGGLATWAAEITGNKIPESWRGKPRR
jgi:hypothetical protein